MVMAIILMVAGSVSAAALLRWARCPGWAVVGGAVAGIVLGPSIFGRVLPAQFEAMYVGGVAQRAVLEHFVRRQQAEAIATERSGAEPEQLAQLAEDQKRDRRELEAAWEESTWTDQRPLRVFMVCVVLLTLLGAGSIASRRNGEPLSLVASMSIGVWSAGLPGGLAFAAVYWLWQGTLAEAALVAAAMAIGPWVLTAIDRDAADQAELGGARMIRTAGVIATILAISAAGFGLWSVHVGAGLLMTVPLLGATLRRPQKEAGIFFRVTQVLLVPTLTACVAIRIDLFEHFALWPIVVILLLSGDARWFGAFVGAMVLGGRRSLRTMRLVLGSMACGPTQLAVTALAIHTRSIPGEFAMALLLGAVLIETTVGARRAMAKRLIQTEQEIEHMTQE